MGCGVKGIDKCVSGYAGRDGEIGVGRAVGRPLILCKERTHGRPFILFDMMLEGEM